MSDAIAVLHLGLKCDFCDYVEDSECSRSLIGKKCPKCGENLLTAEDYSAYVIQMAEIEAVNALVGQVDGEYGPEFSINPRAKRKADGA